MAEAIVYKEAAHQEDYTPVTAKAAGEVIQLADGRAAFVATTLADTCR